MAGQRECPSCATMIPADEDRCFICGYELADSPSRRSWRTWVAIALILVFLIPLIRLILRALG